MIDISVFQDQSITPKESDLARELGSAYSLWNQLKDFVLERYPEGRLEWTYPGKKYGWSFRIKDKKRAIIYLLPREKYFKVAFVFGQKATDTIMESDISPLIKAELEGATKYAEGRGIRFDIRGGALIPDVKRLVEIKLAH